MGWGMGCQRQPEVRLQDQLLFSHFEDQRTKSKDDTLCDKSLRHIAAKHGRQVASSALLLRQGCLRLFCRCDMSHEYKPNSVAATMSFSCHKKRFVAATCRGDLAICRLV